MFKKILSACVVVWALAGARVEAASLSFNFAAPVTQGTEFDVDVVVADLFAGHETDAVVALGFDFSAPGLSLVSVTGDGFLFDPAVVNLPSIGLFAEFMNFPFGIIMPAAPPGPFTLMTLRLLAVASGPTTLTLSGASAPGGLVFFDAGTVPLSGSVDLNVTGAAVPEPTSLLLLSGGLATLVARRRQRRQS